jgi:hypothetical protein
MLGKWDLRVTESIWILSAYCAVADCCECSDGPMGSKSCEEFLHSLSDSKPFSVCSRTLLQ